MTLGTLVTRARRALRKPPGHVARRLLTEAQHELDRFVQPYFGQHFRAKALLSRTATGNIDELWSGLLNASCWAFDPTAMTAADYERVCPGDLARILDAAARAGRHEIHLLGAGPVTLGEQISWH